ncbi:monooxygenase family protein [Methylopila musalis]|uniref:Monooxygenase family protein n=1 Tax=Methylopila musalis TaxID=1134781 RepID=A0ABW3Z8F9_9HYPH
MQRSPSREAPDLSAFPDLVVVLLGFRLRGLRGVPAVWSIGRGLRAIERDPPDGLLASGMFLFGWNHIGIRHYWRDLDSLERFTRASPHDGWWRDFLRDRRGCGFWHEAYRARGGMEGVYIDMPERSGFAAFAPLRPAEGPFMTTRQRLAAPGAGPG